MAENRQYNHEYKMQAVKLAKEIGQARAVKELGVPKNTMYGWVRANRLGNLDLGAGSQTPQSAMTLNEKLTRLRQQVKEQEKEIRRLKKENDFLEEASDGKLYVSAVFDCFDSSVIGLAMDTNMKTPLCVRTLENAGKAYPDIRGAIIHSDRGSQYTSRIYREAICKYGIEQSMNRADGRCHDNARCESMWGRMKSELSYDRYETEKMTTEELKTLIWRYFISYWNNRRLCSANGGLTLW